VIATWQLDGRADAAQQVGEALARVVTRTEDRHRHDGYWPPFCT